MPHCAKIGPPPPPPPPPDRPRQPYCHAHRMMYVVSEPRGSSLQCGVVSRSQTRSWGEKEPDPLTYNVLFNAAPGFRGEEMQNCVKERHKNDNACAVPQSSSGIYQVILLIVCH